MTHAKPNCKDFIPAAIRKIRLNPSQMKEGTKAGTSLYRLWAVASEVYSEDEFREGLQLLLQENILVAVWRRRSFVKGLRQSTSCSEIIKHIPPEMDLGDESWCRDKNGQTIGRSERKKVEFEMILDTKLYIEADGLPQTVTKLQGKKAGSDTLSSQIIAEMNEANKH